MAVFWLPFGNCCKGLPLYQLLAVFAGTLNILATGMHYGWPSPTLPKLLKEDSPIPMTNDESSWIVVVLLFGTFCGADLGAVVLDRLGRKNSILLSSFPIFASWMMVAFAKSVPVLLAARFLAGISDGLVFCALPMYLGEITNPNIRGFAGSYISVSLIFGILLINVIGSYLSIGVTALVSAAVPILSLVTFFWMPESPYYLIMKGHHDKARQNLQILKGMQNVDLELDRLIKAVEQQNASKRSCTDLFTIKHHRKALFIGMGVRSAQQFSGTMVIAFYAQTIFKEAGGNMSSTVASSIYFGVYMIVITFSSLIVDKIGRKPLMIFSIIGSGIALTVVGAYFYIQNKTDLNTTDYTWVPVFALILYVVAYSIGMQPIPALLIGELYPTNVKAFALTCCSNSFSITTTLISKFFQVTKDEFGIHVPFFAFSFFCIFVLMFIIFFVPETKGKTLEEIQEELKGKPLEVKSKELPEKFTRIAAF